MDKPAFGLDLDDLFFDTFRAIILWHNIHYGTRDTHEQMVSYHLCDLWGITSTEANRRVYEFYHSPEHANMPLKSGAKEVVPMLESENSLFIFTARPTSVLAHTQELVGKHFPMLTDRVYLTNRFGAGPETLKSDLCVRFQVQKYVDDAVHHHEDVSRVVPQTLLFEAPWNREYALRLPQSQRVRSWYGIAMRLA